MTQTDEQLCKWRASLDKVTPGEWHIAEPINQTAPYSVIRKDDSGGKISFIQIAGQLKALDAAHLVNCDPQTIGALIDEVLEKRQFFQGYEAKTSRIRNAALDEAAKVARGVPWMPRQYRHYLCEFGDENNPDAGNWAADGEYARARDRAADRILALKTPEREDG